MADHMSPLDAAFLDLEDEEPEVSMAISSVAVFEGPAPAPEEFLAAIRARLPLVPRYRQKARQVPLDLGLPVWVDDPAFDLSYHVRRVALAPPGQDTALHDRIGDIMSQRLDRARPLWEYWVIEGLSGGRWALVSKMHHCMVDGDSGPHLYQVIFEESPEGGAEPPPDVWTPAPEPSTLSLAAGALRELLLNPVEQARMIGRALAAPRATVQHVTDTARGLIALAGALWPASGSTLTGPIGGYRRYTVARASLTDVKEIAHRADVTVNEVVLSAISGGFRHLLLQRGEEPHSRAVRSLVPVSVRARGAEGVCENRVSVMLAFLPVHVADPVERLRAVHEHLAELKASGEAQAGEAMTALAGHEPFLPISWGLRLAAHLPQRHIVTVTTNVPGPREPLYLLGRRALEILPYVPIALRLRTGVSIFTYGDQVTFGVTGDYDSAPEVKPFARAIEHELHALSLAHRPNPAPSVVTLLRPKDRRPRRAATRPSTATKAKAADRRLS
ncbi:WS/DGAT/MGAT family O-acyltransferase [Nonomuraea aurantiaca]|uniref:WS/DGAT/MGAT family O-acyltransferase n=1 Tax=Nonomuraea aurantiaca TaxID=2878562 RepID=UPI001CDA50FB|nr:wax ester/triacylglycerol synthase family O-acyltransferase [Nonomuraea aurantiaca]MCA2229250.1 wax ester/triacylglycerol synthase family O-acyltransferase [Nonomuraea aurantiaca]